MLFLRCGPIEITPQSTPFVNQHESMLTIIGLRRIVVRPKYRKSLLNRLGVPIVFKCLLFAGYI
jgi:hypothetical protein